MSATVARRVLVRGRVQGVFFRDTVRREALRRGVAGWVRNRGDGAVEALFEGDVAGVDALVAFCEVGPPSAIVTTVDVHEAEPEGTDGFSVR